jgi:hypothetical protein
VWRRVRAELGLGDAVSVGDRAVVRVPGQDPVQGTVYAVNSHTLGIRTDTALLRILRGFTGSLMTMHALFDSVPDDAAAGWTAWVTEAVVEGAAV